MSAVVIDTNVILVAKGMSEQAWDECVVTCLERLEKIIDGNEKVVIDDQRLILGEYLDYLDEGDDTTTNGRNGGHFLEWFIRNYQNPDQCIQVNISPTDDLRGFAELPAAFIEFDSDDKKFIAVSIVYENEYQQKTTILQSVDSEWYGLRNVFMEHGLVVEFLCEDNIQHIYERRESR